MSGEVRVCSVDVAPVRAEPDDASEQVTQALRGEPLTVEEDARRLGARPHRVRLPRLDQTRLVGPVPGTSPWDMAPGAASRRRPGRGGAHLPRHAVPLGRDDRARHRLLRARPHVATAVSAASSRATPTSRRRRRAGARGRRCAAATCHVRRRRTARRTSRSGSATAGSCTRPSATTRTASSKKSSRMS